VRAQLSEEMVREMFIKQRRAKAIPGVSTEKIEKIKEDI
jgi:hypothetical protein